MTLKSAAVAAVLIFAASLEAEKVNAATGLVEICAEGTTQGSGQCEHTLRAWVRPAPGDFVLSCTELSAADCTWGESDLRYRLWEQLGDDDLVLTCSADVEPGFMPEDVDPCGSSMADKPRIPKADVAQGYVGSARTSWFMPNEYTDGSNLPLAEIMNTAIFYGRRCDAALLQSSPNMDIVAAPATAYRVPNLPAGPWCFAARVADTEGIESGLSNMASTTVQSRPVSPELEIQSPPAELVTVEDRVYSSRKETERTAMQPVGTAPIGTSCITSEAVLAQGELYWGVPTSAVTWPDGSSVEPIQVYGRCAEP